jgi:hypothetical protein
LAQHIKEAYGEVEKGKRGYKVDSTQDGIVHLAFQLLVGNIVIQVDICGHPPFSTGSTGHRVLGGPRKKMCGVRADELGELPLQLAREVFLRSPGFGI